jgi:hypothetical protein
MAMTIGMSFPRECPAAAVTGFAKRLEAGGIDELWLVEDCFFTTAPPLAAAALATTERLTVGLGILPAVARTAAITAMEIATLSSLAPGRVVGGIGHGIQSWMAQMGVATASPLTTLDEVVSTVRRLLRGETVTFTGREVTRKARSTGALTPLGPTSWDGDTLTLPADCQGCGDIDYEIRVPTGVNVTARTGSGDIELDGAMGTVTLQTGSGDVDANVATRTLTSRTGSGDMDLRLGTAPTQLTANSGSGDVDIRVPDGQGYVLDTRTGSGDRDIDIPQTNGADHRIQVETGSGDISIGAG